MRKSSEVIVLIIGGLIGLIAKVQMLFFTGTSDMDEYYKWGKSALEVTLPRSYHGIYFPLQYQLFAVTAWVVEKTGANFFTIFKLSNLPFDIGAFWLLVVLLRRQGSNPIFALLYWLHPWFLAVFSLGYIDFQFTFCVLLCISLLRSDTGKDFLIAGIPLAAAFLMKPQAQILFIAAFFYGMARFRRRKELRALALLAAPVMLFLAYEIYFIHGLPRPRYIAAWFLPSSYLNVTNVMPSLAAQMTNFWYVIAYLIKEPGQPLHLVSDQIHVLPYLSAKFAAAGVVLALVGWHVLRIERNGELSPSDQFIAIFGFASVLVPFVMTSAHENHLFLGSVFLVLIAARASSLSTKVAIQVLLLVQFLNIYGLYGTHPTLIAEPLRRWQTSETALVYSIICLTCVWFVIKPFWAITSRIEARCPEGI